LISATAKPKSAKFLPGWVGRALASLLAWRGAGYSFGGLLQRLPGIRNVTNLIWALLTIQGRLHRLDLALQQRIQALQSVTEQTTSSLAKRYEDARREDLLEHRFLRREIDLLEARIAAMHVSGTGHDSKDLSARRANRDTWYLDFEEAHRGEVANIRERQRDYLRFIREAIPSLDEGHVLDLGCGRGDWLSLLKEEGISALGVDSNADMVEGARRAGLLVHHSDLFDYLNLLDGQTLAAITAFQLVEHLPLDSLLGFFTEVRRLLRPGGILILETPNPENLQVSGYSFWMDPTHVRPLPPPLLYQLACHFGFVDLRIERANPWPQYRGSVDPLDPLNQLLYCEQDYALIARVPHAPDRVDSDD